MSITYFSFTACHCHCQRARTVSQALIYLYLLFPGTSVEVTIEGRNYLTLAEYGETYVMTPPKLNFRFLPPQVSEWTGDTTVTCVQTGLQATVTYKSRSLLSRGSNRVTGKVCKIDSSEILYSLNGSWDQ